MASRTPTDPAVDKYLVAARAAGREWQKRGDLAVAAAYVARGRRLRVELKSGVVVLLPIDRLQGLADAAPADLRQVRVEGLGTGLYWPSLDIDFHVPNLVAGIFGSKAWMSALAQHAGRVTSPAKAAAARRNGRKGGRPRKTARG
jgi:hypothetical protein